MLIYKKIDIFEGLSILFITYQYRIITRILLNFNVRIEINKYLLNDLQKLT